MRQSMSRRWMSRHWASAALAAAIAGSVLVAGPALPTAAGDRSATADPGSGLSMLDRQAAGQPPSLGRIAIVPLDDRPFTSYTPQAIAEAGAHQPVLPPVELLGEYATAGDADAVDRWWLDATRTTDRSVVAIPMLAYGGLVASRTCHGTTLAAAEQRLKVLAAVKAARPKHRLFAFDVIQLLTIEPTSGYPGMYSGPIRQWAILMDQVENLGREDLRGQYEQVAAGIPGELKSDYLCARSRNHQINREMIQAVADGVIDYLILGQDDASEFGPHRPEKLDLQRMVQTLGVAAKVKIYPGADVLGALLVAKHITEGLAVPTDVSVDWSRTPGGEWVAPYQDIPYATLVTEYVHTLGGTVVDDPAAADVNLMANTAGGGSLVPFADRIHAAMARGRIVAIGDDAYAGKVDAELRTLLAPRIKFGELGGWSGWNVGISLAQAVVRSSLLTASRHGRLDGSPHSRSAPLIAGRISMLQSAATAHQELLLEELAHTDLYRNQVLDQVKALAIARGDDPQNMTTSFDEANQLAVDRTLPLADQLYRDEFAGTSMPLGNSGLIELSAVVNRLDGWSMTLAWRRYQELETFPTLQLSVDPRVRTALTGVAAVPYQVSVRPGFTEKFPLTAIVRNDVGWPVVGVLSAQVPAGWPAPRKITVLLKPFQVKEIPLTITSGPLTAGSSAPIATSFRYTSLLTPRRTFTTTADSVVSAQWRNAAANGAIATASDWTGNYRPEFTIDGNRISSGSRWLTDAADSHWLQVDLAQPTAVDTVQLYHYAGYLLAGYTLSAKVAGSWIVVAHRAANTDPLTTDQFPVVTATAIRLDVTSTSDRRARLYEIEATCRGASGC